MTDVGGNDKEARGQRTSCACLAPGRMRSPTTWRHHRDRDVTCATPRRPQRRAIQAAVRRPKPYSLSEGPAGLLCKPSSPIFQRMLSIDLKGKRAFIAGVADDGGFGFAIAKSLAEAGALVCVGTWPPALGIFQTLLRRGKMDASLALADGRKLDFERIVPLDAEYDVLEQAPTDVRENKRYKELGDFSIQGAADRLRTDFGEPCLDIVVHSLANGSEVSKDLLATSRKGYLGAVGVSAYSHVAMVQRLGPLVRPGGSFLSLSYMASERVFPGYGGGMSSAKAALESDTRVLAWEAGRKWGHRVNCISAGPFASRAASAIGAAPAEAGSPKPKPFIEQMIDYARANSPLPVALEAAEVGNAAAFLSSSLASGITGCVIYVDKGYHAMGKAVG
jgi:enoyl-[acyl-carrier protein] reductase I